MYDDWVKLRVAWLDLKAILIRGQLAPLYRRLRLVGTADWLLGRADAADQERTRLQVPRQ